MLVKDLLRLITPPIFIRLAKRLRLHSNQHIEWEYIPEGWAYALIHPEVKGWNVQNILDVYKEKWPQFVSMVQGTGALGVAHESALNTNVDVNSHNAIMAFGYALGLATHQKTCVTMLDWGGGIGHYYLLAKALQPGVEIMYHCKDVPLLAEYGAQLFPQQYFCSDERCLDQTYDFVLASTALHYTEDWKSLLQRLAGATSGYLYIANLPSIKQTPSFVFVQRPYQYGYNTEYLGWCINRTEFLHTAELAGLDLLREFVYGYQPVIQGAPEQNSYLGYLFRVHSERKI
jgi:putative methyltransferase (TIGR04325 family)